MTRIQSILHSISVAPEYYYNAFFCPVKRDTILFCYSALAISFSWALQDVASFLEFFSASWALIARLISGLTLAMNFIMVILAFAKRIRDWNVKEPIEGRKEFEKRNPKSK
jgi:hypothetical protein